MVYLITLFNKQKNNLLQYKNIDKVKSVGYSGNLNSNLFDLNPVEEVIIKYPDLKFYFIGPFNNQSDVYNKLKQYPNCYFIGKLDELPLIKKLNEMDLLIYNYKPDNKIYYADNSHKILEYLSTGKIILGSNLLAYQNSDLVIQD
ncbi:MAG: hypothetical protein KatS3mg002_1288 [Candidatus Woesearchaeota archaeon]|nr:MAG: hypothetical protein KatS3mg002_1288 [Candidatus Woesearchaeota archaeon]